MWHLCFGLQAGLEENESWLLSFLACLEEHSQGVVGRALIRTVPRLSLDIAAQQGQAKLQHGSVVMEGTPMPTFLWSQLVALLQGCRALFSVFSGECSQPPKGQVWLSLLYVTKRANWHQSTAS